MSQADQASSKDGFVFLGLAIFITVVRTYSRWEFVGFRGFQADDYLVWLAMAFYLGDSINSYTMVTQYTDLANNGMTPEERAALDPNSVEYNARVVSSKLHLLEWFIYICLLWTLKLAVLFNLRRLMDRVDGARMKIKVGFWLLGITFAAVIPVPFLMCLPFNKLWQINPDPGPQCYAETSPAILWTCLACNVLTDVYLTVLPMPMLFKTTLPKVTKFALIFLFGCGILVAGAAILRATLVVTATTDFHTLSLLPIRETFIAVLTTNLPSIFVLLRRWLSPFFSFLRTPKSKISTGMTRNRATFGQDPRSESESGERRTTFIDQMFSKPHGTKTEIYSMKKMGTFSTAEVTGSQEHMVKTTSGGQISEDRSGSPNNRLSGRLTHFRLGHSAPKRNRSRSRSQTFKTTVGCGDDSEKQATEGGITKKVEITISEERSDKPAAYMARVSPKLGAWPLDGIDIEAAAGRANLPRRTSA